MFEPFFSSKDGGTGLGLALARHIVVEHGGAISAKSEECGGAEFVVSLPLVGQ
jgi:signal transduction histidine kinase